MREQGERALTIGAPREIYIAEWDAIAGTDPFVHVALPIME